METPECCEPRSGILEKLQLITDTIDSLADELTSSSSFFQNTTAKFQERVIECVNDYLKSECHRLGSIKTKIVEHEQKYKEMCLDFGKELCEKCPGFESSLEKIKKEAQAYEETIQPVIDSLNQCEDNLKEKRKAHFVSKKSGRVYKVDFRLLREYPTSYFTQSYYNLENRNQEGYTVLDKDDSYFNAILGYMDGQEYDYSQHTLEDNENLARAMQDANLPFSTRMLDIRCSLREKKKINAYKTKVVMVNGKNDPELNAYLLQHHLMDDFFGNTKSRDIHYYEEPSLYFVNLKLKYARYIDEYIRTGTIDLKALKPFPIDPNSFIEEFHQLSIPLSLDTIDIYSPFYESKILREEDRSYLTDWTQEEDHWHLLYRGSDLHFNANQFHTLCDNHANTLVVIKALDEQGQGCVFGGFTSIGWNPFLVSCMDYSVDAIVLATNKMHDEKAFLFTLYNPHHMKPTRFKHEKSYAITYEEYWGPTFFGGFRVCNDCHQVKESCFDVSNSNAYNLPSSLKYNVFFNTDNKTKSASFLVEDYEVFSNK